MLTDIEMEQYFNRHSLIATAREYISFTRASPPFRRVGDHAISNVCVQFASHKMGRTVQAESGTAEFAFALEFEYSEDVIEFWDQPAPIPVTRTLAKGSKRTSGYTPDYLVLSKGGPWVVEVKDSESIQELIEQHPCDWQLQNSEPQFLPANDAFKRIGLRYVVCSTEKLSRMRTSNLQLLLRARLSRSESERCLVPKITSAFRKLPFMTLAQLAKRVSVTDLTPLLALISQRFIHARLSDDLLSRPQTCWIALDPSRLELVPEEVTYRTPGESGAAIELPSEEAMARYACRVDRLSSGIGGRSERRWRATLREGQKRGINSLVALRDGLERSGNRTRRIYPKCEQFLADFIATTYSSPKRPHLRAAFRMYEVEAEQGHPEFPPVSYRTFRNRILALDPAVVAFGRGGRRAANAVALPTDVDSRQLNPTRPLESGSMDHYNANVYVVIGVRGRKKYTARPWISGLVDRFTGMILAVWISLKPPSSLACAVVLRRCVRVHGRLPESIVVDRGPDFRSLFYMSTLASCGVNRLLRPASHARYGSEIERVFGEFETQWLPTLPGNFASKEHSRSISSSHGPGQTAELSLESLWSSFLEYVDWRNATSAALGQPSRAQLQADGIAAISCSGIPLKESPEFIIDTAVETSDVTLEPNGYVRVGEERFWAPQLSRLRAVGKARVRIEPENPHICYVKVDGAWVTAKSSGAPLFEALDTVTQVAESIRLRECVSVRIALRDEAHRDFLRTQRSNAQAPVPETSHNFVLPFETTGDAPVSLFGRARSAELAPFDQNPTEVMRYVLGQKGE